MVMNTVNFPAYQLILRDTAIFWSILLYVLALLDFISRDKWNIESLHRLPVITASRPLNKFLVNPSHRATTPNFTESFLSAKGFFHFSKIFNFWFFLICYFFVLSLTQGNMGSRGRGFGAGGQTSDSPKPLSKCSHQHLWTLPGTIFANIVHKFSYWFKNNDFDFKEYKLKLVFKNNKRSMDLSALLDSCNWYDIGNFLQTCIKNSLL